MIRSSEKIYLRQVGMGDLEILLEWENNPDNWEVSGTKTPFSEEEIIDFIVEQVDFRASGQLRLIISLNKSDEPIGAIDLFDIDEKNATAGVGILIDKPEHRKKGYAGDALLLLTGIARDVFSLRRLHCTIHIHNAGSVRLFEKAGFQLTEKDTGTGINTYVYNL